MAADKEKTAKVLQGIKELQEKTSGTANESSDRNTTATSQNASDRSTVINSNDNKTTPPIQSNQIKKVGRRPVGGTSAMIVNGKRQKDNPLMEHLKKQVRVEFNNEIKADFVTSVNSCVLFLALNYHFLRDEYINLRMQKLGNDFDLRILMVMIPDNYGETRISEGLKDLTKRCILFGYSMIVVWGSEEAARYLTFLKTQENSAPTQIQGQSKEDYLSQLHDVVTSIKKVNRQNAETLVKRFGSLQSAVGAHESQISTIPGWSKDKAQLFKNTVNKPFIANKQYKIEKR